MKIGLLGAGRLGQAHAEVPQGIEAVDELLIADPVTDSAETVTADLGARAGTVESVLAEADAYVIAAASDAHAPLVRAGLERGVPVFCEKPLTPDLADSLALWEHRIVRLEEIPT